MNKKIIPMALAGSLICGQALAVEVTGGEIDLGYSVFTDETDVSKFAITGGVEISFSQAFSLQLDAGTHAFNLTDETGSNVSAHAIYHVDDALSLGAFYGMDRAAGVSTDFYGVEGGYKLANFDVEGYVAHGEDSGVSATVVGLDGTYPVSNAFELGASVDRIDFGSGVRLTRLGVTGTYNVAPNTGLYAELGSVNGSAYGLSDSESYVGIGAKVTFGSDPGTTFGRRSVFELLPGL